MLYHYVATDRAGKVEENDYEAEKVQDVLQFLGSKQLQPVSVKPTQFGRRGIGGFFSRGITIADKVFLMKYLALMLRVGTDLLSAVNILIADFDKPAIREFLVEVRSNLVRGQPFYQTFARYPKVFSVVFVNLVKSGELSGSLQQVFEDLSESTQAEAELRKRITSSMIYPLILLSIGLGVFLFLSFFAIPQIANVFSDSGINPPVFSRIVFAIGRFMGAHVLSISFAIIASIGGAVFFFMETTSGRRIGSRILSGLPVVRNIYRDLAVQHFAATFSSLMKAGIPIIQTTKITAEVMSLGEFRAALVRIADQGLAKGLTLGQSFRRETVFPNVVTNLIAISEDGGHLEEVLKTLADFYTSSIDSSVRSLVAIIEPLLLLFIGLLVGSIALAIIVPIYQLTTQF